MKVTYRSGRTGSASHNDRSYLGDRRGVSDIAIRCACKSVYKATGSLEAAELAFYRERYGQALEAQNRRHIAGGHRDRCKTVEELYKGQRTKPIETILQVGTMSESIPARLLLRVVDTYIERLKNFPGYQCISAALHMDEATPHVHLRGVFEYLGPDGLPHIGQEQALRSMGIPLPYPDKSPGRYNCRVMTWTELQRDIWIQTCRSLGLCIEDPCRCRRRHLPTREYKEQERKKERIRSAELVFPPLHSLDLDALGRDELTR